MALMPDDLMNQRFTPVRFSEGYDMDEVDNFLDNDVVPRLQELIDENGRLTKELEEAHNRIAELESAPSAAAASVEDDDVVEETTVSAEDADATAPQQVVEDSVTEEPVDEEPAAEQPATDAPQDAAGIIVLANRLHDEYVQKGEDERDRLITEANEEHRRIVGEAEEKSRTTLAALEEQKADLDKTIEGLRTFERDYRNRLRNYLENQLRDLDTSETQDKQVNFGL
ncbi:MAG TPA: DivIVA domain-containing protein [Candidatus Brachybacterium merdavium]|uniref:Cell wall synthesis protein Wag31 n=1 Tax=Candidatus Brachybacterium merdavium TaxID=2838513 RepID=A0A9D2LGU4_9MICO|nr:DivIVA domain-containing protein [Candidatus Brachybacterium merdavium]